MPKPRPKIGAFWLGSMDGFEEQAGHDEETINDVVIVFGHPGVQQLDQAKIQPVNHHRQHQLQHYK
jgi:hypothetical protein